MNELGLIALLGVVITHTIIMARRLGKVEGKVDHIHRLIRMANGVEDDEDEI